MPPPARADLPVRSHIVVCTHTTRHLRLALLGAALQAPAARSIALSIDNDDPAVRDRARDCAREFGVPITLVWRPFPGEVRVGQVRNNGVRALLAPGHPCAPGPDDLIYFLDGDSVAPPRLLERASSLAAHADLLIGGRHCLTPEQTELFDESRLRLSDDPVPITPAQLRSARARDRRYRWHLRLKPFGLIKPHKPKVLGASHGVRLSLYKRINGYDERFLGAWREDDDFGLRAFRARARCAVAVAGLCVYHLFHPLNPAKRENWSEVDSRNAPTRCAQGLDSPRPQADLQIEHIGPDLEPARRPDLPTRV